MSEVLEKFFKDGKLVMIPKKLPMKYLLFDYFYDNFEIDVNYSETEVNELLKRYYDDYAILRRYLVDFNYLVRDNHGKNYTKAARKPRDIHNM